MVYICAECSQRSILADNPCVMQDGAMGREGRSAFVPFFLKMCYCTERGRKEVGICATLCVANYKVFPVSSALDNFPGQ